MTLIFTPDSYATPRRLHQTCINKLKQDRPVATLFLLNGLLSSKSTSDGYFDRKNTLFVIDKDVAILGNDIAITS